MGTTTVWRPAPAKLGFLVAGALLLQGAVGVAATAWADVSAKLKQPRFTSAATADLGAVFPGGLAAADFTGDGRSDVAVSLTSFQAGPGVAVVVGDGRGGFAGRVDTTLPGGARACDLSAGDLNGDGRTDLAVSGCGSGAAPVFLLLGQGDGTFAVSQQLPVDSFSLSHPAVGELNGDGRADVAVVLQNGGLFVYFGKGNGKVGKPTEYPAMSSDSIRAVDVTGDGKTDLSFTGPATMVNQGGGVFGPPVGADFFAIASALVDLDGDGILDGIGVDASGGHVLIGHGAADGTYHLVTTIPVPVTQTVSVAGGDFTGDGFGDVVVNGDDNLVFLLAGRGDGRLQAPIGYSTGAMRLTGVDLGGSAATDLVSLTEDPGTVYGVLGGNGGLAAASLVSSKVPGEIALGDLNGDGRSDVVTAGGVLPPDGGFESDLGVDLNRGADLNLDGSIDLALNGQNDITVIGLNRGNGAFMFGARVITPAGPAAVGDVTGDDAPDLLSTPSARDAAFGLTANLPRR